MRVIYVDAGIGERIGERNDANYDKLVSELVSDYSKLEHLCDPSNTTKEHLMSNAFTHRKPISFHALALLFRVSNISRIQVWLVVR